MRIINGRKFGDSDGKKTCHQWNGSSTVDYMIADTSIYTLIQTFQVKDILSHLSDHCAISATINLNVNMKNHVKTKGYLSAPKNIKWNNEVDRIFVAKLRTNQYKSKIDKLSTLDIDQGDKIERAVNDINQILTEAVNIPKLRSNPSHNIRKKKCKKNKPWFSNELSRAKNRLSKAGREFMLNNNDHSLRQIFFKLKKEYKGLVAAKKRQFRQSLYNKLEQMSEKSPKEYWELFDELKKSRSMENNVSQIEDQEWIKHYRKLLGHKDYDTGRLIQIREEIRYLKSEPYFSKLDFAISAKEIEKAIKILKNMKSVGLDQINNEMIKSALPYIILSLRNIFNAILCNKYYPKE